MVLKADQLRVKALLTETITLLCKNGLNYRSEFAIEALIGITLDKDDVFLISIKEKINGGMGILDAGDDPAQKRDFDIDISAAGDSFAAAEPSPADKRENSDGSESDASNSGAAPRKLFKSGQRRRRRRSNDTQGNSQSGDSSAFALPDFDIEKALDDTENLPVASYTASADLCEEGRDNEPTDKKPRVDGEDLGETRVKEEEEDEDDDLIMVKEEAPSNIGSCAYQQSYPQTGQSMSGGMSSAPVFPGSSSWTAPLSMPPAGSASLSSPAHSAQHANNSMLHTPQQANTSMSQQGGTPQSAHMQQASSWEDGRRLGVIYDANSPVVSTHRQSATYQNTYTAFCSPALSVDRGRYTTSYRNGVFTCQVCARTFKQARYLRQHMEMHSEPRYSCGKCARRFRWASMATAHRKVCGKLAPTGKLSAQWSGHQTGQQSIQWSGQLTGQHSGQWSGQQTGQQSGQWSGQQTGQQSGQWGGQQTGQQSGQQSRERSGQETGQQSGQETGLQSGQETGLQSGQHVGQQGGQQGGQQVGEQTGQQSGHCSGQ